MKKKILSLLAAFFMLFGTSAMAQVDSTLEGDVNEDGVVDIADITAVIAIIKQNAEANPTYYWYVGQENPSSIDTSNLKTATNEAGWHLIGTSTSGFTLTFNNQNLIEFDEKKPYYLIIPNSLNVYAGDGNTPVEDKYFVPTDQKITGYKTLLYNTAVWEVKGLVIK